MAKKKAKANKPGRKFGRRKPEKPADDIEETVTPGRDQARKKARGQQAASWHFTTRLISAQHGAGCYQIRYQMVARRGATGRECPGAAPAFLGIHAAFKNHPSGTVTLWLPHSRFES